MVLVNLFCIVLLSVGVLFLAFMILKFSFPGKGLKVIENIFKNTFPFETAVKALKEGKKIRRKSKYTGYTKITISDGKNSTEKFGSYWADDSKKMDDYCTFSIEDILATN